MDDWVRAASEFITALEAEKKADHIAFYNGTGRKRIRDAIDVVNTLRQRLDAMHRG